MKKALALLLAIMMLAAAFAGCGEKKDGTKADGKDGQNGFGTFRTYFVASPPTLNRFVSSDSEGGTIASLTTLLLYQDRVNETKDGWVWNPEGAADFPEKMDEEGKVWRIKLRENATWANGDPLTADDWIYSYQMLLDPEQFNSQANGLTNSNYFYAVNTTEYQNGDCEWKDVGIQKIDDYTLELTGTYGVPQVNIMRYTLSVRPVHKATYEKGMNADRSATLWGTDLENYMCSGPFTLIEWIPDAKFVMERNPNYVFADDIHINRVEYTVVPNASTALQLFMNGDLDYCSIGFADWEQFEDDPRVYEYFNDSLMYFFVNMGNPNNNNLLGQLDFRKALSHAADRVSIANTIGGYPASRLVRRAVQANELTGLAFVNVPQDYVPDATKLYDVTLANEYIDKAFETCKITSGVEMEILLNEDSTHIRTAIEMIQKQFNSAFGNKLTTKIRGVPASQAYALRKWNPSDPTAFDTAFGSLLPSATDPRGTFKFYISSYNPPVVCHSNAEYDAWYQQSIEFDIREQNDEIVELCQKMEKYLIENLIVVPIYEIPTKVLYDTKITLPADGYIIGFGFGERYMTISE